MPLLINDRVDVALAAGVEGVHIGQDDISLESARKILGENAIIGVTASSEDEALTAARSGADYLGIGTVFATPTKENTKSIIGTAGVRQIISRLVEEGHDVKTVCIGGINHSNAQRVLYQTATLHKKLDGVAVVSAIMAASDPKSAASTLRDLIHAPPPFASTLTTPPPALTPASIISAAPGLFSRLAATKPLAHNMTNLVVQNFSANILLAVGASPIMSNSGAEAADLAALHGSLVVNMGTSTPEGRANYRAALRAYNAAGAPVLFDPVGAGATADRRAAVRDLLAAGYFTVIKGNEGEVRTVSGAAGVQQHGVDSGAAQLELAARVDLVRATAARERCVVVMSGTVDVVSDGARTVVVKNGHALLGEITGSGCALGATIAAFLAIEKGDPLSATVAAMLVYEIAAERAAARAEVRGPGTFVPAFLDELYLIRQESVGGNWAWTQAAKIEVV